MKRGMLCVLLAVSMPAAAQSVHKCTDAAGAVSYQSAPCSGKQQTAKTWDARAPVVTPDQQRRIDRDRYAADLAAQQRRQQSGSVAFSPTGRRPSAAEAKRQNCEAAKTRRNRWLAANPKHTFLQRRHWDDFVYDACKG